MAQRAKVADVYADYGNRYPPEQYELLKEVTHWTAGDVEREKQLRAEHVNPSSTLGQSFGELLDMFEFAAFEDTSPDRMSVAVDVWKKTVDVQQHFNDLELRIRNYAVTVIAAMLGLTAYGLKENLQITIFGFHTSVAAALLYSAILPWSAFYLMDRHWYHRLLYGAVHHGQRIERRWQSRLPEITLTDSIGEHSPVKIWKITLHSRHKMSLFYWAGIGVLILSGTIVHLGTIPAHVGQDPTVAPANTPSAPGAPLQPPTSTSPKPVQTPSTSKSNKSGASNPQESTKSPPRPRQSPQ
jgi:hypothetical protein